MYAGQGEWLIHVSLLVKVQPVFKRTISVRGIPGSLLTRHVKAKLQSNLWSTCIKHDTFGTN